MIIETQQLTKYYGKSRGIVEVNLAVRPGEVFGFLGPNGAGKSTTIRLLMDYIRPTSGRASVLGLDAHKDALAIHARTGILPGDLALYPKLTGEENLRYLAHLRGGVDWAFVRQLAERLEADLSRQVKAYSSGNRQKIGLIQAFMHQPELLILDEPTSALDVSVQAQIMNLLKELKWERSISMLFITHDLALASDLCDRIVVVYAGQVREDGPADDVLTAPRDPYTRGLLASLPLLHGDAMPAALAGSPPDPIDPPAGCRFAHRCPVVFDRCAEPPPLVEVVPRHHARCWREVPA